MHNIITLTLKPELVLTLFFAVIIFVLLFLKIRQKKILNLKRNPSISKIGVSQPHVIFVDLSPKSVQVVELAVEIWRIQNRLIKASSNLEDVQKRGLESSIQKLRKFLDNFRIEIVDHTDQKYNEGLSVDVLSFENDPSVKVPMIKETVEPTIVCDGKVVKKGKVVVIKSN